MICEKLSACSIFKSLGMNPVTIELMENYYCLANHLDCARYKVIEALGVNNLPADLTPTQNDRARELITEGLTEFVG